MVAGCASTAVDVKPWLFLPQETIKGLSTSGLAADFMAKSFAFSLILLLYIVTRIMVHYIRYLRTPQVEAATKKCVDVSAVAVIETDLGDSLLSRDVTLIARIVDATKKGEILCSKDLSWKPGTRALKLLLECNPKYAGRLVYVQLTTRETISASSSDLTPPIVDVYSSHFVLKPKGKPELLVERRLALIGKPDARIWEETGNSIARHIWFVVSPMLKLITDSR